jgi:protein gp37
LKNTAIEWADNTINFFIGCTKVSEGCAKCYMYRLETRFGRDPTTVRKTKWESIEVNLRNWKPSRIFVNSMSDTFHDDIPDSDIDRMLNIMEKYPQHTYIILTKRIKRAVEFLHGCEMPENMWIGTSVESEKYLWRINELRKINAKVRFVSFEPLLSFIDLGSADLEGIRWVIVGGESDPNPRLMNGLMVETIHKVCQAKGIAFFFKQWGGSTKCKCHNTWGCRMLEGQTWDELPIKKVIVN